MLISFVLFNILISLNKRVIQSNRSNLRFRRGGFPFLKVHTTWVTDVSRYQDDSHVAGAFSGLRPKVVWLKAEPDAETGSGAWPQALGRWLGVPPSLESSKPSFLSSAWQPLVQLLAFVSLY